jgi:mono/diheme cytochrome c family protein
LKVVVLVLLVEIVGAGIYGYTVVRRGFTVHEPPSALERTLARTIRDVSIPRADREEENPWKDAVTPDVIEDAMAHWADHCATCHANDGSGQTEMGQNLYPPAPDMRLPATQNLTDGELYYIIQNGVRLTGMPGWGNPKELQNDDSWQLVLFIRHLPQMTPAELEKMKTLNPKSMMDAPPEGPADNPPAAGQAHH